MLMAGWDGAEMLRVGTALTAGGNVGTSNFRIRTMSAVVDARTREESRRESPIIDYVDDWPGWKMRIDRFASGDTPKRAAAVLHSARLLLSTFITHPRRLLIQYCGVAGWLAGLQYFAYSCSESCVVFLLISLTKLRWIDYALVCPRTQLRFADRL